ncbi:MAG: HEAT repeat domain-containing protein [Proteobacteria bacterium]|nr:HEAT repeat domain-containing protein [Pseudomonadota bacterium]
MVDPLDELLESLIDETEGLDDTDIVDRPDEARETFQNLPTIDLSDAPLSQEDRGAQRRRVRDLQRLMAVFLKAGKTLRLYSESHRYFAGFTDEFMTRLQEQHEITESLTFEITPHAINWDGHVVFENPEQRENLAFKLYRDGVRLLQFRKGLTPEEVREFVTLVARETDAAKSGSKDLSVLFWEADFKFIHIAVAETFIEFTEEAQRVLEDLEDDLQDLQSKFAFGESESELTAQMFASDEAMFTAGKDGTFSTGLDEDYEPAAYTDFDDPWSEDLGHMVGLDEDAEEEETALPELPPDVSDENRMQAILEDLLGLEAPYASFEEVGVVLAEVVLRERDPDDFATLLRHLDEALSPLLATASIGPLNAILRRLSLLARSAVEQEDFSGELLEQFFVKLCSADRLDLLARAIDLDWNPQWAGEVFTFVSLQSPSSIDELLLFLGKLRSLEARRVVTDSLILLADKRAGPFLPGLSNPNWRLAADAVHALARIGDPTAIDQMLGLFARDEHSLRVEILQAVRPFQSPRIQDLMVAALRDDHPEVRLAALRYLAVYKIRDAVQPISAVMATREFAQRSFDERRGWFITLGSIAGGSAMTAFRRRAEPARGTAVASDDVHLALLGIRSIRTPEALDFLTKFDAQAQGDLRLLTRKLLQQRKGG